MRLEGGRMAALTRAAHETFHAGQRVRILAERWGTGRVVSEGCA